MAVQNLEACILCPRRCQVNRMKGKVGFCSAGINIKIARIAPHHWEEPCISGVSGSGTVFFSNCTLKCLFCQNQEISTGGNGKELTTLQLAEQFIKLQEKGVHNINLVTPTHYVPQIIEALSYAKEKGFNLPVIYNSSGYETVETIRLLKGWVDVYLPDFKYMNDKYAIAYSAAPGYSDHTKAVIAEMFSQVGEPIFNQEEMIIRGVIIRHLMLPGLLFDTKKIVDYIYETYQNKVYLSLMNQYTPIEQVKNHKQLGRKLCEAHYEYIVEYALQIGIENGFIQEGETASESFIPPFDESQIDF